MSGQRFISELKLTDDELRDSALLERLAYAECSRLTAAAIARGMEPQSQSLTVGIEDRPGPDRALPQPGWRRALRLRPRTQPTVEKWLVTELTAGPKTVLQP